MKAFSRSNLSVAERDFRSRVAQLLHGRWLLHATLAPRQRRCGKPNCRCNRGQLHVSLYVVQTRQGQLRQLYVPHPLGVPRAPSRGRLPPTATVAGKSFRARMEAAAKSPGENSVLRRLIHYAEKLYGLRDRLLAEVGDSRLRPPHPDVGRGAVGAGVVLGATGKSQRLGDAGFCAVLEEMAGLRGPQRGHDRTRLRRAGGGRVAAGDSPRLRTTQAQQGAAGASADWGWPSSTAMSPTPATAVAVQDVSSEPCSAAPASRCSITIAK